MLTQEMEAVSMPKNIFIEGLQGMGKSTLLQRLSKRLPEYRVYREGDISPVDLAWCSYMTESEYQAVLERYPDIAEEIRQWTKQEGDHYVVAYTRILTDYPGFHKDLEQFEIYSGRKSLAELKQIVTTRFHAFWKSKECGNLFECAFFQNIIEDLILFHQCSDEEIVNFYQHLFASVDKDSFLLLYLDSEQVEENILQIKKERCDEHGNPIWFELMLNYLKDSPYGRQQGYQNFSDLIRHLKHRQAVERRIIREVLGENARIVPAKVECDDL